MPQPTLTDVHVVSALSNIAIAYLQNNTNFASTRVFPTVPVKHQSDKYFLYPRDAFFRDDSEERAPGTESAGTGYTLTTATYSAREYSVHHDIPDQIRANADSPINSDRDATELVTQQLQIRREKIWIANYFANVWTGIQTGVAGTPGAAQFKQWDQAGSTPIEDIRIQALAIAALTGFKPNKLVLGPYVGNGLINNPEIVDRVKYTQLGFLDYALLAQAFGVDEVIVPLAVQNTATEGATLANGFMYGKSALLAYAAPNPGLMVPSAGYTFSWEGYLNGTADIAISKWREQKIKSDRVEGDMAFDMKLVAADLGCFFATCVS